MAVHGAAGVPSQPQDEVARGVGKGGVEKAAMQQVRIGLLWQGSCSTHHESASHVTVANWLPALCLND